MKRTRFLELVLEGLVGLHRAVQLQLLQHSWSGHRLGLVWFWMACLGNEPISSCHFWDCTQVLHFSGDGNGTPLQYSCLENPMDGGAWKAAVHGVAKSRTRLSDFTFNFHFHALEKEMATHSSVLAWRIPGTEEPSGLLSMGSHRVGHDWSGLAAAAAATAFQTLCWPWGLLHFF